MSVTEPEVVEATEEDPSVALARTVSTVVAKINSGEIDYKALLDALAPAAPEVPAPSKVPLPARITDDQRLALARLVGVFGQVTPAERRELQPVEVNALLDERRVLNTIEKMAAGRKDDIRTVVLNHRDLVVEEAYDEEARAKVRRDKDGHYIVDGAVDGTGTDPEHFKAESRQGTVSLDPSILEKLEGDPELEKLMGRPFTHDDYLALTRPVRVTDEAKTMLALRKDPALVFALRAATKRGTPSIAVTPRKA